MLFAIGTHFYLAWGDLQKMVSGGGGVSSGSAVEGGSSKTGAFKKVVEKAMEVNREEVKQRKMRSTK